MAAKRQISINRKDRLLWIDGQPAAIKPKVFDMLDAFVESPGSLLSRAEILRRVWPETHVSDLSVKDCVKNLRQVLGDDAAEPRFIETVRGHGYRYLGGIEILEDDQVPPSLANPPSPADPPTPADPPPVALAAADGVPPPAPRSAARPALAVALIVAAAILGAAALWLARDAGGEASAGGKAGAGAEAADAASVAVLPFAGLSSGPEADLFAKGLTADLTTAIAHLPGVFVSAGAGAGAGAGADDLASLPVEEVAATLNVRHLLRGGVRREGDRLRVSAELIDARRGGVVWSERYERPAGDVFAVQDDIVLQVIGKLRVTIDEGESLRATADTRDLASWLASTEAYGEFLKFEPAANARARDLWREALERDPDRATPHAGIAFTHYQDALKGWSADRDASIAEGVEHADIAIERNPALPLGYQALGSLAVLQGDRERGLALRRKAVELGPNDFSAVGGLATFLVALGQAEEAIPLFRKAVRLNPNPPQWLPIWYGHALHVAGQPEEAEVWLRRALEGGLGGAHVHARLAAVHADLGHHDKARASVARALTIDPEFSAGALRRAFWISAELVPSWFEDLSDGLGLPD